MKLDSRQKESVTFLFYFTKETVLHCNYTYVLPISKVYKTKLIYYPQHFPHTTY